ncbi:MAG: hypothetical protein E7668_02450 [Ruminococcaceae bacterium]|nr:hypothetical protein [Oscillospiraceae bacterium]
MSGKYKETDYLYASARIRALEAGLLSEEALGRMAEARSSEEILATLPDWGFTVCREGADGTGAVDREATLVSLLIDGYRDIESMTEENAVRFLRFPYDGNNIKTLIKCFSRGLSSEGMLFDGLGTLSAEEARLAFEQKEYDSFPSHMAKAIPEAEQVFAETGNPQKVDLIIDGACYADMREAAQALGSSLAIRWIETRIDLTNLMICVRLMRMGKSPSNAALLREALLKGGSLGVDWFEEAFSEEEVRLGERLALTRYASLASLLESQASLGALEKQTEDLCMEVAQAAKWVPFGIEVPIGYALALETAVKNLRILLAGKDAGFSPEVIRERLRKSYV